jgi:hypothetical protein
MLHIRRRAGTVAALAIMVAVTSATAGAIAASGGGGRQTSGTAYLAATPRTTKGLVYYAGFNSDKVLGRGAATYTIKPTTATSGTITATAKKVTLWTNTGTLSGTGTAMFHITNQPQTGDDTVTGGKIKLTQGTGGQVGHSLVATFTGTGNIVTGEYVFHYKGTYK